MRLLSLAALCSKNSVIEFAAVAEALKINGDDIEAWVIDGKLFSRSPIS